MDDHAADQLTQTDDPLRSVAQRLTVAVDVLREHGLVDTADQLRELAADVEAQIARRDGARLHITVGAGRPRTDPALVTFVDGHEVRCSVACGWVSELPGLDAYPGQVVTDQHRGDGAIVRTWWERRQAGSDA